jgi:DNA-binding Lrp family transcriptional regulator
LNEKKRRKPRDVELRLISELMKNCHRSDRELARAIRVSQPTVSRIRTRLEKEGIIKEYAMIPDFTKLGYEIMGVSFGKLEPQRNGTTTESQEAVAELEQKHPYASLMAVRGIGIGKGVMFITFYRNYGAYAEAMQVARQIPHVSFDSLDGFLVDLNDKNNYRILTMAQIARHILSSEESAARAT